MPYRKTGTDEFDLYNNRLYQTRSTLKKAVVELFRFLDRRDNQMPVNWIQSNDPSDRKKLVHLLTFLRKKARVKT